MGPNSKPAANASDVTIDEILEHYNHYILTLARRSILWRTLPPERLPFALNELAQNVRLKLWKALQKHSIEYVRAYIGSSSSMRR